MWSLVLMSGWAVGQRTGTGNKMRRCLTGMCIQIQDYFKTLVEVIKKNNKNSNDSIEIKISSVVFD